MKKIVLLILVSSLVFGATRGNLTAKQVNAVKKMIQLYGYRCDSVNFAMRSNWSGVIDVTCNNGRYSYDLEDKGGRWVVTLD